jgi:hypothetical protein
MLPLNYAILKYFTTVEEADVTMVMTALEGQYGKFRSFKKKSIIEVLMTAEANGLLEEADFDLDSEKKLRVYYRVPADEAVIINKYIKS